MSISKVEFRLFSGPAQVDLGGLDKPTIVELRFGPKGDDGATGATGATGPAGPNTVTSATTSDGTANLSLSNVSTATATVSGLLTAGHIHGNLAGTLYTHVRTGEAMSKGDPFYISGFHVGSSQPIAMRADAANASKMPAVGVMDADYSANTSSANGIISGTLSSVNTNGYAVNSPIYVANGGGYSNTAGTIPQQIGITERANASTGAFIVTNSKVISFADVSDAQSYTAELNLLQVNTGVLIVTDGITIETLDYNFGTGSAQALKDAIQIASADITDATSDGDANKEKLLKTDDEGSLTLSYLTTQGSIICNGSISIYKGSNSGSFQSENITASRSYQSPNASGTLALTANTSGIPDKLSGGEITGATFVNASSLTFNTTSYTYGTGAAAAHRTALGLGTLATQNADAATLSGTTTFNGTVYNYGTGAATQHKAALDLFTLLTMQESDAGSYTANAGTAQATQDGDLISLSASTANQRPNVYRFRNWSRNPGNSSNANPVMPLKLASAGVIIHAGTNANGGSFRCGIGMVNGSSAVAADANATTGRGFGWRIAWNSSTSKLEFNLWAHNGTTYVEGSGIDTGLGATNLDGFFNVVVCLAADGTVTANTWFGTNTALSTPSTTPTATLAGGPTSGTFANQGIPLWIAAAHSTNAPSGANTIIARVINRKLQVG